MLALFVQVDLAGSDGAVDLTARPDQDRNLDRSLTRDFSLAKRSEGRFQFRA
jgi:hypothetical protein